MDNSQVIAFCVGYLMGATDKKWNVEIHQENADFRIECSYNEYVWETRSIDFYMVQIAHIGFEKIIAQHLCEIVCAYKKAELR